MKNIEITYPDDYSFDFDDYSFGLDDYPFDLKEGEDKNPEDFVEEQE